MASKPKKRSRPDCLKYKETYPELLLSLFKEGHDIAAFCAEANINKKTFHAWVATYPEFAEAYDLALPKAESYWFNIGREGALGKIPINPTMWSIIMRNRFGYTEHRKIRVKKFDDAITPLKMVDAIRIEVCDGTITASEATQLASIALAAARIEENTALREKASFLEDTLAQLVESRK